MELKTNYQYTYFIYPFIVKQNKYKEYITKMLNGKVISTKLLSKDTYDAMQRIVIKGTLGNTTTSPSNNVPVTEQPKVEENTGTENNVDKKDETTQTPEETGTSSEQTEQ